MKVNMVNLIYPDYKIEVAIEDNYSIDQENIALHVYRDYGRRQRTTYRDHMGHTCLGEYYAHSIAGKAYLISNLSSGEINL